MFLYCWQLELTRDLGGGDGMVVRELGVVETWELGSSCVSWSPGGTTKS